MIKAASKAFHRVFPEETSSISQFVNGQGAGLRFHERAHELNLGALNQTQIHENLVNFSTQNPVSAITVTHVDNSMESLPITNQQSMINLHYTSPFSQVLPNGAAKVFDIDTLEEEDLSYDVNISVV